MGVLLSYNCWRLPRSRRYDQLLAIHPYVYIYVSRCANAVIDFVWMHMRRVLIAEGCLGIPRFSMARAFCGLGRRVREVWKILRVEYRIVAMGEAEITE